MNTSERPPEYVYESLSLDVIDLSKIDERTKGEWRMRLMDFSDLLSEISARNEERRKLALQEPVNEHTN